MNLSTTNFVLSLVAALAGEGAGTLGTDLFAQGRVESGSGDEAAYAVFRNYPGDALDPLRPIPNTNIQVMAMHKSRATAMALAEKIFAALYDEEDDGDLPRHHWLIPGKKIADGQVVDDASQQYEALEVAPLQQPSEIGVDAGSGRRQVVFNFKVIFQVIET